MVYSGRPTLHPFGASLWLFKYVPDVFVFVCNAALATKKDWLRSAVNGAVSARVAEPGARLKAQPFRWTKFCLINPYGNGC